MENTFNTMNVPEVQERRFGTADSVLAWLCFIGGYLFCLIMPVTDNPFGGLLFTVGAYIATFIFLKIRHCKIGLLPFFVSCSAILLSASLFFSSNALLQKLCYTYALASLGFVIYAASGNRVRGGFSALLAVDYFKALVILPFCSLGCIFRAAFISKKTRKPALKLLLGIALAVIPTAVIAGLLSYDDSFRELMSKIIELDFYTVMSHISAITFGVPVAMYFFGAFTSGSDGKCRSFITAQSCSAAAERIKIAPALTVVTAVAPILFLYVVFFISQWQYYVSAFTGVLPDGITYASYAREGFFQLCAVSVINLVIIVIAVMFARRSRVLLKVLTVLFTLSTLVLISTALAKMALYIGEYGLTQRRVYASWFMVLIALTFVVITLSQFIPRMSALAWSGAVWVIMFAAITLSNVDGIIADYNVDQYISGKMDEVDIGSLIELGDPAVPALVRLHEKTDDKNDRERIKEYLEEVKEQLDDTDIFSITLPKLTAMESLSRIQPEPFDSELYTDSEIQSAIDVTKSYFKKHFSGCTLKSITYLGDEGTEDHAEFAKRHDADEVIVLTSSFYVRPDGGDGSLNQDSTYEDWKWILVRNNGGKWRHVDHGY